MLDKFILSYISYAQVILPWFVVGIAIAVVLEKKLKPSVIKRYFGRTSLKNLIVAQMLGMISPLSIMSFIPIAGGLVALGASPGLLFSFFIAERAYDLQSFFVISSLFGVKMAIFNAVAIFVALVATALSLKNDHLKISSRGKQEKNNFWQRQFKLLVTVILGIGVGSGLRVLIPESLFQQIAGTSLGGIISGLVIGFSLYFGPILGNYPVAKAFADLGMSSVGVLTFLTVSPILNFIIMMMFSNLVGMFKIIKPVLIYSLVGLTLTVVFGIFL